MAYPYITNDDLVDADGNDLLRMGITLPDGAIVHYSQFHSDYSWSDELIIYEFSGLFFVVISEDHHYEVTQDDALEMMIDFEQRYTNEPPVA